jgi:hypothetical protein
MGHFLSSLVATHFTAQEKHLGARDFIETLNRARINARVRHDSKEETAYSCIFLCNSHTIIIIIVIVPGFQSHTVHTTPLSAFSIQPLCLFILLRHRGLSLTDSFRQSVVISGN